MTSVVIDASVAVKWVVEESHSGEALRVLVQYGLIAPALLHAEAASALAKAVKRREMSTDQAVRKMLALVDVEIETVPDAYLCPEAITLAARLDHSVYDCFYLALAAAEEAPLITADRKLVSVARDSGLNVDVVWIGDVE